MNVKPNVKTIGLVVGLVLLASVPSVYFYRQYRTTQEKLAHPTQFAQEEAKLLKEKVGKLIELPVDEEPTIATVSDADRLREQPFFANAQNGDKVLIFTNARKAILYRPSTNKIIEVAPVNIGNNQPPSATESAQPATTATPTTTPIEVSTGTPTPTPTEAGN